MKHRVQCFFFFWHVYKFTKNQSCRENITGNVLALKVAGQILISGISYGPLNTTSSNSWELLMEPEACLHLKCLPWQIHQNEMQNIFIILKIHHLHIIPNDSPSWDDLPTFYLKIYFGHLLWKKPINIGCLLCLVSFIHNAFKVSLAHIIIQHYIYVKTIFLEVPWFPKA